MPPVPSRLPSEFTEDEFQALAFAELAIRFRGIAVGGPYIADRRKERTHGVDVWIRIREGGRFRALFLQYKVPELVIAPTLDHGCSALYGGKPYFRFKLHKDARDRKAGASNVHRQHNNLVALRRGSGHPAYYCSPAFNPYQDLQNAFYRGSIYDSCLLGDPRSIGYVRGRNTHHVSFASDLRAWGFHSEPRSLGRPTAWADVLVGGESKEWAADDLNELADEIARVVDTDLSDAPAPGNAGLSPRDGQGGPTAVLRVAHAADDAFGGPVMFVPEVPRPMP